MTAFTIGKVAAAAGVHVETVRYYERRGLISRPSTRRGKYREYAPDTVDAIRFIKRSQDLGFSLAEIEELLQLAESPQADRKYVRALAVSKVESIQEKIEDLKRMEKVLSGLVKECNGHGPLHGCPIIETITADPHVQQEDQDGRHNA